MKFNALQHVQSEKRVMPVTGDVAGRRLLPVQDPSHEGGHHAHGRQTLHFPSVENLHDLKRDAHYTCGQESTKALAGGPIVKVTTATAVTEVQIERHQVRSMSSVCRLRPQKALRWQEHLVPCVHFGTTPRYV